MKKDTINYQLYFDTLKKSNNFSELSEEVLEDFLTMFYLETWSKGQMSFDGDKTLHKFYFVVSGRVKMYQINPENGKEYTLYINSSGDFFDLICLLDNKRHKIEMEALDDVVLLSTSTDIAREWILKHPKFNRMFLPYIANQLREMEEKTNDLALLDTWTRTLKLFVKHTKSNVNNTELKLINNLSHSEIAKILGTSKNIINLHLQKLKKKGFIDVKRNATKVKNLEGIIDLIEKK